VACQIRQKSIVTKNSGTSTRRTRGTKRRPRVNYRAGKTHITSGPDATTGVLVVAVPVRVRDGTDTSQPTVSRRKFEQLAAQWRRETRYVSSISQKSMHPAYQKIIAMGPSVIPLILSDLAQTHDHWLWALFVLTDHDPAPEDATFSQAIDAWLAWGRSKKLLK
jgi:hypothetical protein